MHRITTIAAVALFCALGAGPVAGHAGTPAGIATAAPANAADALAAAGAPRDTAGPASCPQPRLADSTSSYCDNCDCR